MFFSRVGHVEQEVHGSENGSAETALEERLKNCQISCIVYMSHSIEVDLSGALLDNM